MPPNGDPRTRAYRALPRMVQAANAENRKRARLGWQKSEDNIVLEAPGGNGRFYITFNGTRDFAVRATNIPLARRLPILVERIHEVNYIVDIDWSNPTEVQDVLDNEYGVYPHATTHKDGGTDEVATTIAAPGAIPKAGGDGYLDAAWLDPADLATGAVSSVNGQTGDVVLDADGIDETASRVWFTPAEETKLAGIATGANAYVHPNHTGDVTSSGDGATTIASNAVTTAKVIDDAITNAKLGNMAQNTVKGRITASAGDPEDLTAAQVRTIINVADGADVTSAAITGLATKATPVDADAVVITDSAASNAPKRTTWANIKAKLTDLFNPLYVTVTGSVAQTVTGVKTFTDNMIIGTGAIAGVANLFLTQAGASLMRINSDTSGNPEVRFMMDGSSKVSMGVERSDDSFRLTNATSIAATSGLNLLSNRLGMGILPEGKLHIHDGTTGWLHRTITGVNGTPQTILVAGSITKHIFVNMLGDDGTNVGSRTNTVVAISGTTTIVCGTTTATLTVTAGGALTIQRTAGTGTLTVSLEIMYK